MSHRTLATCFAILAAGAAFAAEDKPSGAGVLTLPMSVRQAGMANIVAGGSDVSRAWSNPAVLAELGSQGEIALGGGKVFSQWQDEIALAGAWKFSPSFGAGLMVVNHRVSFPEVDGLGEETDNKLDQVVGGYGLGVGYSWEWLRMGLNAKVAVESFNKDEKSISCGDLGFRGVFGAYSVDLAFNNLGGEFRPTNGETPDDAEFSPGEALPIGLRLGGAYRAPFRTTIAAELHQTRNSDTELGAGAEYSPVDWFALRMGLGVAQPNDKGGKFSFGFSGNWSNFGLDYGMIAQGAGVANRVSISYAFSPGKAGEQAAPPPPREEKREEPVPPPAAAAAPVPAGTRLNVAIADLRGENVSAGDAAVIADLLRNELVKTGVFNVIEKQNMDKVLSEHAFQQTGCTSEECAVKLGKLLNVQRMAVGSFGKLMDSYILSIRVVNVESGAITFADSAEGRTVSDLRAGVKDMASRMAKQLR